MALPSTCSPPSSLPSAFEHAFDIVGVHGLESAVRKHLSHSDAPLASETSSPASLLDVAVQRHGSALTSAVYGADPAVVSLLSLNPSLRSSSSSSSSNTHSAYIHDAVVEGWRLNNAYAQSGPESVVKRGHVSKEDLVAALGSDTVVTATNRKVVLMNANGKEATFSWRAPLDAFALSELVHYTNLLSGGVAAAPSWTVVSIDTLPVFASGWGCDSDKYAIVSELYGSLAARSVQRAGVDLAWSALESVAPTSIAHDGAGTVRAVYTHPLVAWTDSVPSDYVHGVTRVEAEAESAKNGYTLNEIALAQILIWVVVIMTLSLCAAIKCAMALDDGPKDSLLFMSTGQKSKMD